LLNPDIVRTVVFIRFGHSISSFRQTYRILDTSL